MEPEKRLFRADPLKLKRLRVQFCLTIEQFCEQGDLDKATARKLLKGTPVSLGSLKSAALLFRITDHLELLHPEELMALGVDPAVTAPAKWVQEWKVEAHLTPWERTANGLQFHIARLRHRFLPTRVARGKCYELRHLAVAERQRLEGHLRRHPEVCETIGHHPNVAENITAVFVDNGGLWWVLDVFEEGLTLADRLVEGPLDEWALKPVMLGIADGLRALHRKEIVRRELTPRFVLLRKKDRTPVLTDFELAKLLDGAPTVSPPGDWPDNPYLAPEVVSRGTVDERADLYSWGRVFVHALLGHLPEPGPDANAVRSSGLPPAVRAVLIACLALPKSDRPAAVADVQKVLKRW
jgi:serine/threonine protein kinase